MPKTNQPKESPPAPNNVPPGADPPRETVYTLADLVRRTGPATAEEVLELVEGHDRDELIADGADVATPRISTDCARDYGRALDFWQEATSEKKRLVGMDDSLLRTAIWSAAHGQELYDRLKSGGSDSGGVQGIRQADAADARKRGKAARNQLHSMLKLIAGGHKVLVAQLGNAYATASDDKALADSIKNLASLGRVWLGSKDAGIVKRRKKTSLDAARLDEAEKLSAEVRKKGEEAGSARSASPVTQGEVDFWDGINLQLYSQIVELFDSARDTDPTLPRLAPISLRRFFRGSAKRKTGETEGQTGGEDAGSAIG